MVALRVLAQLPVDACRKALPPTGRLGVMSVMAVAVLIVELWSNNTSIRWSARGRCGNSTEPCTVGQVRSKHTARW